MLLNRKGHSHSLGCIYINDFPCPNATVLSTKANFPPPQTEPPQLLDYLKYRLAFQWVYLILVSSAYSKLLT